MKSKIHMAGQVIILFLVLCVGVGMVAFPLVFSEAVISNFINLIQLIARVT